jgi:SAM-dependent methyltransferase
MPAANATTRFSDRVDHYVRYRPGYPLEMFDCLAHDYGLTAGAIVGDIGSGTGISARLFLERGCAVYGVEPNAAMRAAAERDLATFPAFHSIAATAEETTLESGSLDWYVAAQAFHWFDVPRARHEAQRVLRSGGRALLVWNDRRDDTPFLVDYDAFLHQFGTDYAAVSHRNATADGRVPEFFGGAPQQLGFAYSQRFNLDGLTGRVLSSSYTPPPQDPRHAPMLAALHELFERHASGGTVDFAYTTRVFVGTLR